MFITLTNRGGSKIRVNTEKIISYSADGEIIRSENSGTSVKLTMLVLESSVLNIKESPEEVDEILRVSYITVYNRS